MRECIHVRVHVGIADRVTSKLKNLHTFVFRQAIYYICTSAISSCACSALSENTNIIV